jgi:hypothetical protein|tara:strand:+ start:1990 stop:2400 length:411 start_codon:yes stop_codon:yes gene_type:complete
MSTQILVLKLKKKNGQLIMPTNLSKEQYKLFLTSISEGAEVEALFELKSNDNTKAQLAKIHVCIKELADEQGETVNEMKKLVKRECGMSYTNDKKVVVYESFAKCSKAELSIVIETIIQMGSFMNINFHETLDLKE